MNTEIYMVRHAHSVFSLEHEETRDLSEKGWDDAGKITRILAGENIDYVVSSSYVRARQTVEGLAELLQKDIQIEARFRERDLAARDFHFEDPESAMRHVFSDPVFKYPGGESNQEVQDRGITALKEWVERYPGKRMAVGIHGNIMTCTMNFFDKKYDFDFWKSTTKPDIYKLTIDKDFRLINCTRMWEEVYANRL
jgi:2,3-bisphosphoglycerate-dependent phosphoglycerate mutase